MTKQVCTFTVGDILFGIDVMMIQEVLRPQAMTKVPLAPSVIRGLINLRGQILTAFDLRERLLLSPAPGDVPGMNIVVQLPDGAVSLLVDEVGEVLDLADDRYELPPVTLERSVRDVTDSIYKLKDRLLLLLNVASAVTPPTRISPGKHNDFDQTT